MTDYQVVRSRRRTAALQVDQSGSVIVRAQIGRASCRERVYLCV